MSALSAVQPRSAAPGRPGRPTEGGGGEDFSAVLAAVGGVPAAPTTPTAKGESTAPQGQALSLPTPQLPAEPAAATGAEVPLESVPAPAAARPSALAPATPATPAAPAAPAVPTAVPAPATEPAVPQAVVSATAPAPGAASPAGAPTPAEADLLLVTDVQVRHEPAPPQAPPAEAVLPVDEAPEQAPAAQAAAAVTADSTPDLPPVAAATAPSPATTSVAAPAAPAQAAPPPPPPAAQLVSGLAPVLEGPDGTHTMSLQLYPEELGAVQVEISLRNGEISLALRTPDVGTLELLRSAASDLRTQLESTGLTSTGVSVDLGRGDEKPAEQGPSGRGTRSGDGRPGDPADEPATTLSTSDSALDVRI